ncbi:MAG: trypsin-like peptidase domain-containing protein [Solirubrobacterales bacterium]|jgi:S1-C subfamily serine protease|nr:trypsin-like peptidase domain-containing protein [Solirubrobacterales bacterium]
MRKSTFAPVLLAAFMGGGVTAGALLGAGVIDTDTTTIVQPAPLGVERPASDSGAGGAMTARDIYRRDAPGVVFIRSQTVERGTSPFDLGGGSAQPQSVSTGSGFVVDDEGFILTNAHVVSGSTDLRVSFSDKRTREARIVGKDESTDLALLKVDPAGLQLRPLALGDSKTVQVGDPTVAIGNPFGLDRTLTTGVVSALQRRISAPNGFGIDNVIQTDAAINPGNSGGPLIDAAGRVIGINSQIATGGGAGSGGSVGIGFAVPVNTAKEVIPQLKAEGRVQRAYLGVTGVGIDQSLAPLNLSAKSGVLVQEATQGGPADDAGIRGGDPSTQTTVDGSQVAVGGDVITKVDGKPVDSMDDVVSAVDARRPGARLKVEILRDGKAQTLEVTLENRPARAPNG